MRILFLFGLIIFMSTASSAYEKEKSHPFYVSIISIDHNDNAESLEVTFKIFTDDFEMGIEEESDTKLNLTSPNQAKNADEVISAYIKKHFELLIDGEIKQWNYIGFESEYDVVRIYIEFEGIKDFSKAEIATDILLDVLEDQSNIVHFNFTGTTKSLMLNSRQRRGKLEFK